MDNIIKASKLSDYERARIEFILLRDDDVIATSTTWDGPLSDDSDPNHDISGWT